MTNTNRREALIRVFEDVEFIAERTESLALKLFKLISLLYTLKLLIRH
jgi:hypothetical protein